ncbi:MAG: MoaD/ThiS family protein, partial [Burkholderiaceae bacterium]|nr:MoaD/ThiS family protein [Burkholderiaceae bacterium]
MQVTLKLFASLNRYLPANKINTIEAIIQVPDG